MVTVTLHGALATAAGRSVWSLDVSSPAEALRAIDANTGTVLSYLVDHQQAEFRVLVNQRDIRSLSQVGAMQHADLRSVEFLPVLAGSGGGGWMTIIGLVLIAAVLLIASGGTSAGFTMAAMKTAFAGSSALTMGLTLGITLTLGGISQLLAPTMSLDSTERPENKVSYIFDGAVNTYRQGGAIPVGFGGPLLIGSQVIAAGIRSIDIPQSA